MVLYALSVLPLISICDKATSDDLFVDLITSTKEKVMLDSTTFSNHIGILQDKYKCLGISCEMGEYFFNFGLKFKHSFRLSVTSSAHVCLQTQLGYILVSMLTHSVIFLMLGIRFLRATGQIMMNHFR